MSIMDHAKAELSRANFGVDDTTVMLSVLRQFLFQWDSGGAAAAAVEVFNRLIAGQPLSPLTGREDEWIDRTEHNDRPTWQNARCSSVFRERRAEGFVYYDIEEEPLDGQDRFYVTMPYDPMTHMVQMPVVEIGTAENPIELPALK